MPKTVYSLNDVHMQIIYPETFKIELVDEKKNSLRKTRKNENFANAGFFMPQSNGVTVPVGNLVIDGKVITDTKHQSTNLSTCKHSVTTFVIYDDNTMGFVKTDDMSQVSGVKYAISGVPIIRNGRKVDMAAIKGEGYFGNELYNTWHGFLGLRGSQIVYVASKIDFELMVYLLEYLGITDAIKLDGGGSFILHNNTSFEIKTGENRQINTIIKW